MQVRPDLGRFLPKRRHRGPFIPNSHIALPEDIFYLDLYSLFGKRRNHTRLEGRQVKPVLPDKLNGVTDIGDLNAKRAKVLGMNPEDGLNIIEAQVPQAEVLRYAINLKSITQGRGSFTVEFSHYEEIPLQTSQRIIAERQAEKEKS